MNSFGWWPNSARLYLPARKPTLFGWTVCLGACCVSSRGFADELKDIRGPVAIPSDAIWLWVLLAAVLAGITVFLISRIKRRPRAPVLVPPRPSWEIAGEALNALEKEEHSTAEQIKRFYSRLSEIIRVYIERRFEIRAPEMTTEEFLEAAYASAALKDNQKRALRDLLNASDLVKFARSIPSAGDVGESMQLARRFVEETKAPAGIGDQPPAGPIAS